MCSKFNLYLKVNRWIYDETRGISITSQHPQKAKAMNAVPKSQFEPSGEAHGARFSNGSNIRSARVTKKKVEEEQGNEDDKEEDDNHVDLTDPPPASVPATKRAKSAAPQWTAKLEAALTASVKKWTGKASNGGIAWVHVQTDMHMTKHHVMSHWKKIEHAKAPSTPRKKPTAKTPTAKKRPPVRVFSPCLFLFILF